MFTLGELFILPTGLGLFARLAPPSLGATTVAAWFFAIFTGSLTAGFVGTLWSRMTHALFFAILAAIAALSAAMLLLLDVRTRRIETARAAQVGTLARSDRVGLMRDANATGSGWFQRFLLPGFAFKAVVIGGGYATGRELAEFFLPSGPWGGIAAMLLAMVIWSVVCVATFLFARSSGARDYLSFFRALLGRGWVVFEVAYIGSCADPRRVRRRGGRDRRGDVRSAEDRRYARADDCASPASSCSATRRSSVCSSTCRSCSTASTCCSSCSRHALRRPHRRGLRDRRRRRPAGRRAA